MPEKRSMVQVSKDGKIKTENNSDEEELVLEEMSNSSNHTPRQRVRYLSSNPIKNDLKDIK